VFKKFIGCLTLTAAGVYEMVLYFL